MAEGAGTAALWKGKPIAAAIEEELKEKVTALASRARPPRLVVLLVGDDPASHVYVGQKEKAAVRIGIDAETRRRPADMTEAQLLAEVQALNADPGVDGILVQLPLPKGMSADRVLMALDPDKDVDGFHPVNLGRLASGEPCMAPCTPLGIVEMMLRNDCAPRGREVVIVGRSRIVGLPLSLLLVRKGDGGDATVTICHSRSRDLAAQCQRAEILVAAVGSPELVRGDWIRPGAAVIDVGITRVPDESSPKGYRLVGDVHFEEASKVAGAITPVPGGVGPLTVAMLMRNTYDAAVRRIGIANAASGHASS